MKYIHFSGLKASIFLGFPSIQEVECSGAMLKSGSKLLSLQMFEDFESSVIASLNLYESNCMTYGEYSSCIINTTNPHESRLRVLVHELQEGEARKFGCIAISVQSSGKTASETRTLVVLPQSRWMSFNCLFFFLLIFKAMCLCVK